MLREIVACPKIIYQDSKTRKIVPGNYLLFLSSEVLISSNQPLHLLEMFISLLTKEKGPFLKCCLQGPIQLHPAVWVAIHCHMHSICAVVY